MSEATGGYRTAVATEVRAQLAAARAADDPVKLRQAVRIVRVGLAAGKVSADELTPMPELVEGRRKGRRRPA